MTDAEALVVRTIALDPRRRVIRLLMVGDNGRQQMTAELSRAEVGRLIGDLHGALGNLDFPGSSPDGAIHTPENDR